MDGTRAPVKTPGRAGVVSLLGGVLCLDFINTVEPRVGPRHGGQPHDYLTTYDDLVTWGRHAGALTGVEAESLRHMAEDDPVGAGMVLEQAVALREAMYDVFFAVARRQDPDTEHLAAISTAYAGAMSNARLVTTATGFDMAWVGDPVTLTRPLWPIARSAVELLLHGERRRIKDCPTGTEGCGWLFYDTSKNVSRQWCSMRGCGTEAKERRRAKRARIVASGETA